MLDTNRQRQHVVNLGQKSDKKDTTVFRKENDKSDFSEHEVCHRLPSF